NANLSVRNFEKNVHSRKMTMLSSSVGPPDRGPTALSVPPLASVFAAGGICLRRISLRLRRRWRGSGRAEIARMA
ncbi:hypothetical protein RUND412_005854, partial [Rhizina undulata]